MWRQEKSVDKATDCIVEQSCPENQGGFPGFRGVQIPPLFSCHSIDLSTLIAFPRSYYYDSLLYKKNSLI